MEQFLEYQLLNDDEIPEPIKKMAEVEQGHHRVDVL